MDVSVDGNICLGFSQVGTAVCVNRSSCPVALDIKSSSMGICVASNSIVSNSFFSIQIRLVSVRGHIKVQPSDFLGWYLSSLDRCDTGNLVPGNSS